MKCLKALGLAAVAAMALTAFIGASSASATVLCTTTPPVGTACGTAWHVDTIVATAITSLGLHSTGGALEATCTTVSSTAEKASTGSATTTPVGVVTTAHLTFGGCSQTTETIGGGELEVHQIAGTDNGTVTGKAFRVTLEIAGLTCIYGFGSGVDLGVLTGGHDPVIHMNTVVLKQSGSNFLCPSNSVWEGTFTITNHTSVYVVEK